MKTTTTTTTKPPRGRPKTRPVTVKLSEADQRIVQGFLRVRQEQARLAADRFEDALKVISEDWSAGQLAYLRSVESAITYLLSTLDHPVEWLTPNAQDGP